MIRKKTFRISRIIHLFDVRLRISAANCCGICARVRKPPISTDAATSNMTTAVCMPPSSIARLRWRKSICRYHRPTSNAATTARPAASVAVTKPPKIPPRMITGSEKAGSAAMKVSRNLLVLNASSTGKW